MKRLNCADCTKILISNDSNDIEDGYLKILNRGGLLIPCHAITQLCSKYFAILDVVQDLLLLHASNNIRDSAERILHHYSPSVTFSCPVHLVTSRKWVCRTICNIFLNNEQNISSSLIRKDEIKSFNEGTSNREEKINNFSRLNTLKNGYFYSHTSKKSLYFGGKGIEKFIVYSVL